MRRLTFIVASLIMLAIPAVATKARAEQPTCRQGKAGDSVECEGQFVSIVPAAVGGNTSGSSRSSSPTKKYLPYDRLTTGPDGNACIATGYYEEGTAAPRPPQPGNNEEQTPGSISSIFDSAPPCPEQPRAPGQPAPIETRAMVAARYWERVPLPKPQPMIAPGRAITGKLAYLETRGELSRTYTNNTVFGPLTIVAKGSYMVDWGDGETSGPHSFEGKPWPDGQITHDYLKIGAYDVVVTEKWTATWRLGGESGVLRTLQTTGRIDDFPVQQIQAVISQ